MYVGSVFSIIGALTFAFLWHVEGVDPSVQLQTGLDGPSFGLYEKNATYSPVGATVTTLSWLQIGNSTFSLRYNPVAVFELARTVCEFVVQVCIPQWSAISLTHMYHF